MGKRGVLRRGEKGPYGRSSKKPTVGRDDDLQWIASTTYSRFLGGGIRGPYIIYGVPGLRSSYMSGRKYSPPDPKDLRWIRGASQRELSRSFSPSHLMRIRVVTGRLLACGWVAVWERGARDKLQLSAQSDGPVSSKPRWMTNYHPRLC